MWLVQGNLVGCEVLAFIVLSKGQREQLQYMTSTSTNAYPHTRMHMYGMDMVDVWSTLR